MIGREGADRLLLLMTDSPDGACVRGILTEQHSSVRLHRRLDVLLYLASTLFVPFPELSRDSCVVVLSTAYLIAFSEHRRTVVNGAVS